MDFYGGSADVDLKALLELLKADDDPICVHQHVETLRQAISIADERRLQDFPTGGYITRLIEVLGHTIMMDFQVETKCKCQLTAIRPFHSIVSADKATTSNAATIYEDGWLARFPLLTLVVSLIYLLPSINQLMTGV